MTSVRKINKKTNQMNAYIILRKLRGEREREREREREGRGINYDGYLVIFSMSLLTGLKYYCTNKLQGTTVIFGGKNVKTINFFNNGHVKFFATR